MSIPHYWQAKEQAPALKRTLSAGLKAGMTLSVRIDPIDPQIRFCRWLKG
ncbi:hypothetical protein [Bartonella apis]|nr:hypothetical protein [Bartonella apis]